MFSKLQQNLDEEEFNVSDAENTNDLIDESDDLLTAKIFSKFNL